VIGLTKEQKNSWDSFVLSCQQGKTPCVQSEDRRQAILAVANFLSQYVHSYDSIYLVNEALVDSSVVLVSAGLSAKQENNGYVGTICAAVQQFAGDGVPGVSQDLHVTKKQLEQLKETIERFLEGK
jgi:hypothetical protein